MTTLRKLAVHWTEAEVGQDVFPEEMNEGPGLVSQEAMKVLGTSIVDLLNNVERLESKLDSLLKYNREVGKQ